MSGRLASLDGALLNRTNNVTMSNNNLSVTTFGYGDTILTYDDGQTDNRFWGISDRDVPILIGAAAGAVGLVFLILGAVVIWYCCQFVFQGEGKNGSSMYSFDYEDSEEASISSEATVPFSDSAYFVSGRTSKSHTKGSSLDDLKRSQSTPLNVVSIRIFRKVSRSISNFMSFLLFISEQVGTFGAFILFSFFYTIQGRRRSIHFSNYEYNVIIDCRVWSFFDFLCCSSKEGMERRIIIFAVFRPVFHSV